MKLFATAAAVVLSASLLTSCGGGGGNSSDNSVSTSENLTEAESTPAPNIDPAEGWVLISNYDDPGNVAVLEKICDGTTLIRVSLVYGGRGEVVYEADSRECPAR